MRNKQLEAGEIEIMRSENKRLTDRVEFLEKIISDDADEKAREDDKKIGVLQNA